MTFIINPYAFKQILGEGGLLKVTQLVVENLSLVIPLAPEPISIETYPLEVSDFSILYVPAKVSEFKVSSSPVAISQLEVYDTSHRPAGWPNQEPSDIFVRLAAVPEPVSDIKVYDYNLRPAGEEPYAPPSDLEVVNLHPLQVTDLEVINLSSNDRNKYYKTDAKFLYPLRSSDVYSVQKREDGNISRNYPKLNIFVPKSTLGEKAIGALNMLRKYINQMLFEGEDKILEDSKNEGTPLIEFLPKFNDDNSTHIVLDFSYTAYDADLAASDSGIYKSDKNLGVTIKSEEINEGITNLINAYSALNSDQCYNRLNYSFNPNLDTDDETYKFFRKSLIDALFEIIYGEGNEELYTWHNYFGINQDGSSPNLWEYGYSFYEQKDESVAGIAQDIVKWLNLPKYPKDNIFSLSNGNVKNGHFNCKLDANITGRAAIFDPEIQGGVRYTQSGWKIEISEDSTGSTILQKIDLGSYLPTVTSINTSDYLKNELQYLSVYDNQTLDSLDSLYVSSGASDIKILDFTSRSSANPSVLSASDNTITIYEQYISGNNSSITTLDINAGAIIKIDYKKLLSRTNQGVETYESNNSIISLRVTEVVYLYDSSGNKFVKIYFEELSKFAGKSKLYANLLAEPAPGYESYEKSKEWVEITRSPFEVSHLSTKFSPSTSDVVLHVDAYDNTVDTNQSSITSFVNKNSSYGNLDAISEYNATISTDEQNSLKYFNVGEGSGYQYNGALDIDHSINPIVFHFVINYETIEGSGNKRILHVQDPYFSYWSHYYDANSNPYFFQQNGAGHSAFAKNIGLKLGWGIVTYILDGSLAKIVYTKNGISNFRQNTNFGGSNNLTAFDMFKDANGKIAECILTNQTNIDEYITYLSDKWSI